MHSTALPRTAAVACAGGLASACLLLALYRQRRRRRNGSMPGRSGGEEDEAGEVPEEFVDPITFSCMADPALLCGTGQVYCLRSLRAWLATGSRTCPKTNMKMRDVEVVRLPSLRSRIASWLSQNGLPPLPPLDPPPEVAQAAGGAGLARILQDLRSGDVYKRGVAAGAMNDVIIDWGREPLMAERQAIMEAVLLDLVWLLRQGDPYGASVAAAALSQYDQPGQVAFLAAVAAIPAVALLWSPHSYGQHSTARLLARLAGATPSMPDVLVEAGAARGLLQQLDLRQPFPYSRCSAAAALSALCACAAGQEEVRAGGGLALLKALVLQEEPDTIQGEVMVRFDQRDAASCLLALELTEEEAAQEPAVDHSMLLLLSHCSHAWLLGRAGGPTEGYSADELTARMDRLALGEVADSDEEEGTEGEEDEARGDGEEGGGEEGAGGEEGVEGGAAA